MKSSFYTEMNRKRSKNGCTSSNGRSHSLTINAGNPMSAKQFGDLPRQPGNNNAFRVQQNDPRGHENSANVVDKN